MSDIELEPGGDPAELLARGLRLHHAGDGVAATACLRAVPEGHPGYAEALHSLGLIAFADGRLEEAEARVRQAAGLAPGAADYHYNLGTILAGGGKWRAAADAFRAGLALRPQDAAALNNMGNALLRLGEADKARDAFARALKYDRSNPAIRLNLAAACEAAGQADEAETGLRRLIADRPGDADALVNLAALLLRRWAPQEAVALLERALALCPDMPAALANLAVARRHLGRAAEAEALFRRLLAANPGNHEAWNGLAVCLHDQGRADEAAAAVDKALELRPDHPAALLTLANLEKDAGRPSRAVELCRRALESAPESPEAHWNLALSLLTLGELEEGFREFEWRLRLPQARHLYGDAGLPLWQGEPPEGKRILLRSEQGLGDTLQFVRYAPLLAAKGATVLLECQPPLKRLLADMPGLATVVAAGEPLPAADLWCPLMSLPQRFDTTLASVPGSTPYLAAPPVEAAAWAARLPAGRAGPRVGLVWAGAPRPEDPESNRIDRRRSLRFDDLAPLLAVEGVSFLSLQKGEAAGQLAASPLGGRVFDPTPGLADMADTAALLAGLDLVISVDTSVAHLAGALGVPVWLLSRFAGCWRWLIDREDSPWYPSLRLFRQDGSRAWEPVITRVAEELAAWATARPA